MQLIIHRQHVLFYLIFIDQDIVVTTVVNRLLPIYIFQKHNQEQKNTCFTVIISREFTITLNWNMTYTYINESERFNVNQILVIIARDLKILKIRNYSARLNKFKLECVQWLMFQHSPRLETGHLFQNCPVESGRFSKFHVCMYLEQF